MTTQPRVYYNEIDRYAATWLRNLIAAGHLPDGDVDTRSIVDVQPQDLDGYTHCHFFAGIGGWAQAVTLAGWPLTRPLWTGSCPCQPFSVAGKHAGTKDERHLWPEFHRLIDARRPAVVVGEQVASKDGREWFTGVHADLAASNYESRAIDLCVAGIGAPHIRNRLFWVGDSDSARLERQRASSNLHDQSGRLEALAARHTPAAGFCPDAWKPFELIAGPSRIEPGVYPVAYGVPCRVGQLRAYGGAIVPQMGALVLQAYLEGEGVQA